MEDCQFKQCILVWQCLISGPMPSRCSSEKKKMTFHRERTLFSLEFQLITDSPISALSGIPYAQWLADAPSACLKLVNNATSDGFAFTCVP